MRTAVVPVAGLGTRLLPATRAIPKELLPVGRKPVVQHVVEELAASGIERVVFVTARGKEAIAAHFGGDDSGLALEFVEQPAMRGLGDAVLCAEPAVGSEPFAVALGDAVIGTGERVDVVACLGQALQTHGAACAIAVRDVPRAQAGRYGILSTDGERVTAIVEKPDPASAPSTLAIAARYAMTPAIFDAIRETAPDSKGEVGLSQAIALLLERGERIRAVRLPPGVVRHDVGSHESYAEAFLRFALADPEYGGRLRALLLLDGP